MGATRFVGVASPGDMLCSPQVRVVPAGALTESDREKLERSGSQREARKMACQYGVVQGFYNYLSNKEHFVQFLPWRPQWSEKTGGVFDIYCCLA